LPNDQYSLEELKALDAQKKHQKDFDDLNAEMAGRPNGMYRFLSPEHQERVEEEKRGGYRKREPRLAELLRDPKYAQIYSETVDTYERAAAAADRALRKLDRKLTAAETRLNDIRAEAAELPSGRKVFRSDQSGRIYGETGVALSPQEADTVRTPAYAPSWETFESARQERDELRARRDAVTEYQSEVLAPTHERLNDLDNPATKSELKDRKARMESAMPSDMLDEYDAPVPGREIDIRNTASAASYYVGDAGLNAPNMTAHFESARNAPATPAAAPMPNREFVPKSEF
jgi:hypothetical protein